MTITGDSSLIAASDCHDLFFSAEEAWFWGVQGMLCRLAGARVLAGMASAERPCEASDVINCAAELERARRLSREEIGVLFLYGRYAIPPHALGVRHRAAVPVWERAMALLKVLMEQKGIIAISANGGDHGR